LRLAANNEKGDSQEKRDKSWSVLVIVIWNLFVIWDL
jgi:hypothetical protein